jgi:hypothetical protein
MVDCTYCLWDNYDLRLISSPDGNVLTGDRLNSELGDKYGRGHGSLFGESGYAELAAIEIYKTVKVEFLALGLYFFGKPNPTLPL